MKKYGYGWLLKFVLAAILLGVGIYLIFEKEVVYLITGVAIVIFSLFRVVPLMKTLNKEVLRTINLIEILIDLVIGGVLIYVAVADKIDTSSIWNFVYRYSLAFFFYARALVFFTSVVFFEEKTEVPKFVAHIISITVGSIIAVWEGFDHVTVALLILIISFIGAAYLGYDGFNGYKKYRNFQLELQEGKRAADGERTQKEIEADLDVVIDEKEEDRPTVN